MMQSHDISELETIQATNKPQTTEFKPTRRFITGLDATDNSRLLCSEMIEAFTPYALFPSFQLQELFYSEDNPQTLATRHLIKSYDINLPCGALRFLTARMPTKTEMIADLKQAGEPIPSDWRQYNLHSTDSVDYCYILSGHITAIVGHESFDMQPGDFLAQVGPEHTWINPHDEPCYMLCVMLGIESNRTRKKMLVE